MSARQDIPGTMTRDLDRLIPAQQPFLELDLEKIKSDLNLAAEGNARGEKNLPSSGSATVDDVEQRIITTVETKLHRDQQLFTDQLNAYHQAMAGLDLENEAINISSAAQRASSEFVVKLDEGKAALFTLWRNVCMIENQWNDFRNKHGLLYPADYPISRLWNFAVIIAILAIESILNGNFLARGLETGLIGGVIQAFVIAAINVLFGFFLGDTVVRYLFHRNWFLRALAFIELPVSCCLAVAFNLMVGHYRNALGGPDPLNASSIAWNSFTLHPFSLEVFQSWMLFGMGLFFYAVAACDGFKMDDPYPGYGKINRKHEEIIQDYTNEKANIVNDLSRTRDRAIEYMHEARQKLANRRAELASLRDLRARHIQLFESHQNHLNHAANDLLSTYRNANIHARNEAAPARFNTAYAMAKIVPPAPPPFVVNDTQLDAHIEKTNAALVDAISQVNTRFEEAAGGFRQVGKFVHEGDHAVRSTTPA